VILDLDARFLWSAALALVLCACSAGLIVWHVRARKRLRAAEIDAFERHFRRRQFRRRMQTSAMLGVLGAAIFVGQLMMLWVASPLFVAVYWSAVVLLVLWMLLLAMADMADTGLFYSRQTGNSAVEHSRLQGELQKAIEDEARQRNGRPSTEERRRAD
jgi:ABC-type Fe3+ transport system permease subunit